MTKHSRSDRETREPVASDEVDGGVGGGDDTPIREDGDKLDGGGGSTSGLETRIRRNSTMATLKRRSVVSGRPGSKKDPAEGKYLLSPCPHLEEGWCRNVTLVIHYVETLPFRRFDVVHRRGP